MTGPKTEGWYRHRENSAKTHSAHIYFPGDFSSRCGIHNFIQGKMLEVNPIGDGNICSRCILLMDD